MLKLDDIDAFVAVVRCESLRDAALTLGLTQPAVTRRLQNLEEALGVALLNRQAKPLRPTPLGKVVHEQCRLIHREMDRLRELVTEESRCEGHLHLGVAQTVADVALVAALDDLKTRFPQVQARVSTGWGTQLLQKLDDGMLDAAIVLMPTASEFPDAQHAVSLGRLELAVVAKQGLLRRPIASLADCNRHGWVLNPDGCGFRAGLQRALSDQGLPLRVNLETFGTALQRKLIADGAGFGLIPHALLQTAESDKAPLDVVTLHDFKPAIDVWIVQPKTPCRLRPAIDAIACSVQMQFDAARLAAAA